MTTSPGHLLKEAARKAPGLPDPRKKGQLTDLSPGQLIDLFVQEHNARRAGKHHDLRFGTPETGLFSWAVPRGLPSADKAQAKHLAIRQPLHSHSYGPFSGTIPAGTYGAGEVKSTMVGKARITRIDPDGVSFTTDQVEHPERFRLIHTRGDNWLLINTTPHDMNSPPKVRYTKVSPEDVKRLFSPSNFVSAKIDGSREWLKILGSKLKSLSYRTPMKAGQPAPYTQKVAAEESPVLSETQDPEIKRWHRRFDLHKDGENIGFIVVARQQIPDATPKRAITIKQDPGDDYTIQGFYVAPAYRGKGYGRQLMDYVKEQYKGKRIVLRPRPYEMDDGVVDEGSSRQKMTLAELRGMYRRLGFRKSSREHHLMVQRVKEATQKVAEEENGDDKGEVVERIPARLPRQRYLPPAFDPIVRAYTGEGGGSIPRPLMKPVDKTKTDPNFGVQPSAKITADDMRYAADKAGVGTYVVQHDSPASWGFFRDHSGRGATLMVPPEGSSYRAHLLHEWTHLKDPALGRYSYSISPYAHSISPYEHELPAMVVENVAGGIPRDRWINQYMYKHGPGLKGDTRDFDAVAHWMKKLRGDTELRKKYEQFLRYHRRKGVQEQEAFMERVAARNAAKQQGAGS